MGPASGGRDGHRDDHFFTDEDRCNGIHGNVQAAEIGPGMD